MSDIINRLESEVRSYCRSFPATFVRAEGDLIFDQMDRAYVDFFAGAGALNYGHNNPILRDSLIEYISRSGIVHALDMSTEAKIAFLESFEERILKPRNLSYKVMFPGPTGTNAVEAALKLARKVTGRTQIVAFTNAFHGMTLGSLAATGNAGKRAAAGVALHDVSRMPFDGFLGPSVDTLDYLAAMLGDSSSGIDAPAAFIVETLQGEGGINAAGARWLSRLAKIAKQHGSLLIIDDIQVGCGRTGPFFSFESLGVEPDMVCLSKSLSGYGLPFALTLFRPELDIWKPGEHNGTFRGNNLAFVTATAALDTYWKDHRLEDVIDVKAAHVSERLTRMASSFDLETKGRGLMQGLAFEDGAIPGKVVSEAFQRGLIIETSGTNDEVLKVMPPLTIAEEHLDVGLDILDRSIRAAMACRQKSKSRVSMSPAALATELN